MRKTYDVVPVTKIFGILVEDAVTLNKHKMLRSEKYKLVSVTLCVKKQRMALKWVAQKVFDSKCLSSEQPYTVQV